MNYLSDLYNAKQLYDTTHKEKANEVVLGINVYRFIKNRIEHMNWDAKFDDKGILREVLGLNIKIDYFCPNLIEVRRNVYLNDPIGYIWLNKEEIESAIPNDELSTLIDNDLKDLHSWIKFEEYYKNNKDKEELNEGNKIFI